KTCKNESLIRSAVLVDWWEKVNRRIFRAAGDDTGLISYPIRYARHTRLAPSIDTAALRGDAHRRRFNPR
ncbi:hypothetical protein, partial [Sphingomonas sp.]|uniref:hypothetical protein n=1 Tax=Sphingomonas sp. TaxID=28214 RepID=UPI0035A8FD6B